jgi:hypothetical protein
MKNLFALLLFASTASAQTQTAAPSETFAAAKLSAQEVREILAGVEASAFDRPDSWEAELRVSRVDLGAGRGLVVRGTKLLCGGTGNCQTWVFRNVRGRWVSLFTEAPLGESFQLGPAVTGGIKDFTIVANVSAESGKRVTYKYDGKVYRAK